MSSEVETSARWPDLVRKAYCFAYRHSVFSNAGLFIVVVVGALFLFDACTRGQK